MDGLQWYPRYTGDYARKTKHLTMLEHGAYTLLLDYYYATAKPLQCFSIATSNAPSNADLLPDHSRIYRICGAITRAEQEAVDNILEMFFEIEAGQGYVNKRAMQVIEQQQQKHDNRVEAGRKSALNKVSNAPSNATNNATSNTPQNQNQNQIYKIYIEGIEYDNGSLFEKFWNIYPSGKPKGNRGKAQEKFKAIFKRMVTGELDHEQFIKSVTKYAKFCEAGNYNQHAVTWLNQAGWETDWSEQVQPTTSRPQQRPLQSPRTGNLDTIIDASQKAKESIWKNQ
jgi:uncharacterized protein YdaU (DUF1376 family)